MDRVTLSLVAAPLVFAVCALLTRAPARRLGAALAGGAAFAAGNLAADVLAHRAGWWHYPGAGLHAPLHWYAFAGLAAAGISLIGWRVTRRAGARGLLAFLGAFGVYCALRDLAAAHGASPRIVFGAGAVPWLADAAAGLTLMAIATLLQLALGGDSQRLRGSL